MATYTGNDKKLQYLFGRTEDMIGATAEADGVAGIAPAPEAGDENKYLKGDGTWATVQAGASALSSLTDVNLTSPMDGQALIYDANNQEWVNGAGGGGLPGQGYTGSDLILRDAEGNISGVWYIDSGGNWTEYTTGGGGSVGGHTFGMLQPTATSTITNSFSISVE